MDETGPTTTAQTAKPPPGSCAAFLEEHDRIKYSRSYQGDEGIRVWNMLEEYHGEGCDMSCRHSNEEPERYDAEVDNSGFGLGLYPPGEADPAKVYVTMESAANYPHTRVSAGSARHPCCEIVSAPHIHGYGRTLLRAVFAEDQG
jgi:hypothetical protein